MKISVDKISLNFFVIEAYFTGTDFYYCKNGVPFKHIQTVGFYLDDTAAIADMRALTLDNFYSSDSFHFDTAEISVRRYTVQNYQSAERKEICAKKNLLTNKES